MALTTREKKWADAKIASWGRLSNSEAAEQAGYNPANAGANANRLAKKQDIIDYINEKTNGNADFILNKGKRVRRTKQSVIESKEKQKKEIEQSQKRFTNPYDYAVAVMNGEIEADRDKLKAAEVAVSAMRVQQSGVGKKEQRDLFASSLANAGNDSVSGSLFRIFQPQPQQA